MRRNWIKLYVDQILGGSMMDELKNDERWSWIGLLLLAGDSRVEGHVCVINNIGYTDEQICGLLDIPLKTFKKAKDKMIKHKKIKVLENNVIQIVNWKKYQSEYRRQKKYRDSYNQKLQPKVTTKSDTLEERREKEEKRYNTNIYNNIYSQWNSFAEKHGLSKIEKLNNTRKAKIKARTKDKNFDIQKLFEHIEKQPFLFGDNDRGWTVNFDMAFSASGYLKIMEEQYLERKLDDAKQNSLKEWAREQDKKRGEK